MRFAHHPTARQSMIFKAALAHPKSDRFLAGQESVPHLPCSSPIAHTGDPGLVAPML
jgi:hypothetical protein